MSDLSVRDTTPDSRGTWGRGIVVQTGGSLTGERVELAGHHELALSAASAGTVVEIADLVVRDTEERACGDSTCADAPAGIGVGSYLGASMRLTRFQLTRAALCGAQIARGGGLDLSMGEVSHQPVGVCLQDDGYDVARLTDQVLFLENERAVERTDFALPEPSAPSGT